MHRNHHRFINVESMSYRSLFNEQACFLDETLMNHQCYQCALDWGRDSITTTSELLTFVDSLLFSPLSYNLLRYESAWVAISLISIISLVNDDKILWLSVTCKINRAALKNLQNYIYVSSAKFLKTTYKIPPNFIKFFEETWKISQQTTKFRYGKFNINHLKLLQKLFSNI